MEKLKNLNESRSILFRGKREDNGEWVEGFIAKLEKKAWIFTEDDYELHESGFMIDSNTIGEYTGLTDKNGRKIFEGDIVNRYWGDGDSVHSISIIQYEVKKALWSFELIWVDCETKKYMRDKSAHDGVDTLSPFADEDVRCDLLEIIGNIHDDLIVEFEVMK